MGENVAADIAKLRFTCCSAKSNEVFWYPDRTIPESVGDRQVEPRQQVALERVGERWT